MAKHRKENLVVSALRACTWNNLKQWLFNLIGKQNKKKKEKKHSNNKWEDIPPDVLQTIMKDFGLKDYVGLRAVCSSWRAIVSNAIANKHCCHPLPELPCILLFSDASTIFNLRTKRELFQKSLVLNSSGQEKKICHGTVEGWLILSESVGKKSFLISFFNPVTHAAILVPPVLKFPYPIQKKLHLEKMVASSEPNSPSKSDCYLVGLILDDHSHIAYCKLNDMSWNMIEIKKFRVLDLEIIGSKLYIIAISKTRKSLDSMMVYDLLQDSSSNPPKAKVLAKLPPSPNQTITQSGTKRSVCGNITCYIAKDDASGELFLIYMFCNFTYEMEHDGRFISKFVIPPKITSVETFMLDTKKKKKKAKWTKVKDLGDRVLFVSSYKSIVMSRATLNSSNAVTNFLGTRTGYVGILQELFRRIVTMSNTKEVIEGNNIYFAAGYFACPSNPWEGVELGKICLIDNRISYFSVKKSNHQNTPYPCWFLPSV